MRAIYIVILLALVFSVTFAQEPTPESTTQPEPTQAPTVTEQTPAPQPTPVETATPVVTMPTPITTPVATTTPIIAPTVTPVSPKGAEETACPAVSPPSCPDGKLAARYDANSCVTGYDCIKYSQPACPPSPSKPTCPSDSRLDPIYDNNGCLKEYRCVTSPGAVCSQIYAPVCGKDGKTYSNDCFAKSSGVEISRTGACEEKPFCGNYKCEIGEDQNNCPQDCGKPIPKDCRTEKDPAGFERFICEGDFKPTCPVIPSDAEDKCKREGGTFIKKTDPSGCTVSFCDFGATSTSPLQGPSKCHTYEEVQKIREKCSSVGLPIQFVTVGEDCRVARCGQKEEKRCPDISFEVRQDIEKKCKEQGLGVISAFDEKGCGILQCSDLNACQRDVPREAYEQCKADGGEVVVNRDHGGCVTFFDCIRRGNENEVFAEDIDEIPEATELLTIAFKLEELKIAFDKLSRQSDQIAEYYKSTGSSEAERFIRIADMFESAKDKVNEIRGELRDKLRDITVNDLMGVRQDIRYIKDVMMKDIVYFMLSSGDDVSELKSKDTKDCGSRGECFDRAFRVCKQVVFYPEGKDGPKLDVVGLEGDACIVKAQLPEDAGPPPGAVPGINPPYEMTCKIKNYALGMRNPEEDMFPYCTGNMIELIKKYGTGPPQRGGEFREPLSENRCDCTWAAGTREHPKGCPVFCSDYSDQTSCESQARNGCVWIFAQPASGGGFKEEFEQGEFRQPVSQQRTVTQQRVQPKQPQPSGFGEQKCPDGICDEFEMANPGACPQDCGGRISQGV